MAFLKLDGYSLSIEKLNQVLNGGMKIELSSESMQAVEKSCNIIKSKFFFKMQNLYFSLKSIFGKQTKKKSIFLKRQNQKAFQSMD